MFAIVLLFVLGGEASARELAVHGFQWLGVSDSERALIMSDVRDALAASGPVALATEVTPMCGTSLHCHCEAARRRGDEAAVFGNVSRLGDIHTMELILVDAHGCGVKNTIYQHKRLPDGALSGELAFLAGELVSPAGSSSTTAVKQKRPVDATPASVQVVTREEMDAMGVWRLEQVFDLVPGFDRIPMNWGTRVLHQELPGTVLVMVDGVPLSNPYSYFSTLGVDFDASLHHVERIEFVRGPSSVLWGGQAFMGVVNLITHRPEREGTTARAGARAWTDGGLEVHGQVAQGHDRLRYGLSASIRRSPSSEVFVADSPYSMIGLGADTPVVWGRAGTSVPHVDEHTDLTGWVQVGERLTLSVQQHAYDNRFEISPFGSLLDDDHPGRWERTHRIYRADWQDTLPADVQLAVTASRYELTWFDEFALHPAHPDGHPDGLTVMQGNRIEPSVTHTLEAQLGKSHALLGGDNRVLVGVSHTRNELPDSYATPTGQDARTDSPVLDMASRDVARTGVFVHDEWAWSEDGALSVGTRFEHWSTGQNVWTSQAGLVKRTGPAVSKLVYAEGFRPPLANDLYSTVGVQGQTDLRPERSRALLGESRFDVTEALDVTAGASATWISELVELDSELADPGFVSRPVNRGGLRVDSAFVSTKLRTPTVDLTVAGAVHQHSEAASDPSHDIARWSLQTGAAWRPLNDVSAYARGTLSGARTVPVLTAASQAPVTRHLSPVPSLDMGVKFQNLYRDLHVEVTFVNPLRFETLAPYRVDGAPTAMVERHVASELMVGLVWTR